MVTVPPRAAVSRRRFLVQLLAVAGASRAQGDTPSVLLRRHGGERAAYLRQSWAEGRTLAAVVTGPPGSPPVLQFVDPLCAYFPRQWWALWPQRAVLRVHWILVGAVHERSAAVAASVLADARPAQRLEELARSGPPPSLAPASAWQRSQVEAATRFWSRRLGFLPCTLYHPPQGPRAAYGVMTPADVQALVAALRPSPSLLPLPSPSP